MREVLMLTRFRVVYGIQKYRNSNVEMIVGCCVKNNKEIIYLPLSKYM